MNTPSCTVPLEGEPLDVSVSPTCGLLAAALVTGQLQLASFSCPPHSPDASSQLAFQLQLTVPAPTPQATSGAAQPSKKKQKKAASANAGAAGAAAAAGEPPSCRAVCFSSDGDVVLAGYADHAVRSYDVAGGRQVAVYDGEHDAQLSRVFALGPHLFASGDEDGLVALWDTRIGAATYRYKQHTDYITDFALQTGDQALVVTSGDATLSVHDLRKSKAMARSEDDNDDELLSVAVVKGGKKVVAGTQSGVLNIFSWGYFNDCSDRFPGHPESVQALVAFDDDTLLTGSSDGGIRVVGVLPNRLLGILGQHNEDFPVERLALSSDRRVLASASHDAAVKLWDLSILLEEDDGDDDDGGGDDDDDGAPLNRAGGDLASAAGAAATMASGRRRFGDEDEDVEERRKRRQLKEGEEGEDPEDVEDEGEDGEEEEDTEEGESDEEDGGEEEDEDEDAAEGLGSDSGEEGGPGEEVKAAIRGKKGDGKGKGAGSGVAAAGAKKPGGSDDDSDDDSDIGDGKPKKGRVRERTRWTKGAEQKKQPSGNFFADLL